MGCLWNSSALQVYCSTSLGPDKSKALPMFHAYTGCDTVSSFNSILEERRPLGKVSAGLTSIGEDVVASIEIFTILL